MSPAIWIPLASAVVAGIVALMAAMIAARSSPYSALSDRVSKLELRVQTLEAEQGIDRAHITDVHWWDHIGRPGPLPYPPAWYRDKYTDWTPTEGTDG